MARSFQVVVPDSKDPEVLAQAVSTSLSTFLRMETRIALLRLQADEISNEVGPEIVLHTLGITLDDPPDQSRDLDEI